MPLCVHVYICTRVCVYSYQSEKGLWRLTEKHTAQRLFRGSCVAFNRLVLSIMYACVCVDVCDVCMYRCSKHRVKRLRQAVSFGGSKLVLAEHTVVRWVSYNVYTRNSIWHSILLISYYMLVGRNLLAVYFEQVSSVYYLWTYVCMYVCVGFCHVCIYTYSRHYETVFYGIAKHVW